MEPEAEEGPLEDEDALDEEGMMEDGELEEEKPEDNPFYSSYKEAIENEEEENIEDPLKKEREKKLKQVEEDEAALKEIEDKEKSTGESSSKVTKAGPGRDFDKHDKSKAELEALGMAATLKMVETDKYKIKAEVENEERRRKEAEKSLRADSWEAEEKRSARKNKNRSRRADPNNPTKEEVDAQQEMENLTWADRWMKNKKVKHVVQSSKMMSKVKIKMKEKIKSSNPALQPESE